MVNIEGLRNDEQGLSDAFLIGDALAQHVTKVVFKNYPAIVLEAEYVAWGYILWPTRKRYISRKFESPSQKEAKIDTKGVEFVRRDQPLVLQKLYEELLNVMMPRTRDPPLLPSELWSLAQPIIIKWMDKIANDELGVEFYEISKSIKNIESYANPERLSQCIVAKSRSKRVKDGFDKRPPPMAGERMPLVQIVTQGSTPPSKKMQRCYLSAEDPWWVTKYPNRCRVDRSYYLYRMMTPIGKLIFHMPYSKRMHAQKYFDSAILYVESKIGHLRSGSSQMFQKKKMKRFDCSQIACKFVPEPKKQVNFITSMLIPVETPTSTPKRVQPTKKKREVKEGNKKIQWKRGWSNDLNNNTTHQVWLIYPLQY